MRRILAAALVAAACLIGTTVAFGASTKRVSVGDDYFGPTHVTVKAGTKIRWVWLADNWDSHDVKLVKAPRGVRRFHSASAATDYTFTRTLTKRGTYRFLCTLHQGMRMTIRVR